MRQETESRHRVGTLLSRSGVTWSNANNLGGTFEVKEKKKNQKEKVLRSPRLCLSLLNRRDPAQGWLMQNAASPRLGCSGKGRAGDGQRDPISDLADQSSSTGPGVAVGESQTKDLS